MLHWMAYADLRFGESAHLALARAIEESGSDALAALPNAWIVEDRKITLQIEIDTPKSEMMAMKQLLVSLLRGAEKGEAVIEAPPFERWSRHAGGPGAAALFGDKTDSQIPESEDRTTVPLALDGEATPELETSPWVPDVRKSSLR